MANHTDIQDDHGVTGTAADGAPLDDPPVPGPLDAFVADLDRLRRRAARGTGRTRVSLEQLADATGIPRSTLHSYLRGQRLPPSDVLDRIVLALGATPVEQAGWAELLDRLAVPSRRETSVPTRVPSAVAQTAPSVPRVVPRLLPAAPGGFVGRVGELARLDEVVDAHDPSGTAPLVVCLTGTGGVGKTALALTWAHANADRFPDGQLWVDLRGYAPGAPLDPADALERLLRAIGVGTTELPADVDARADLFRSSVAGSRALIVLDNARNLAQVQPLLAGTSGTVTVVTSRDSLRSLVVSVGAIRVPVERLADDDALDLMTARLSADAAEQVRRSGLVAQCEGLPLALRIVRERLDPAEHADIGRFADDLTRDRGGLLESLDLFDASVDLSVRSAFDWSYDALSPDAARLFRLLPLCLSPTLDVDEAGALLDRDTVTTRRLLEQLVAAHLLDPAGRGLVRVHDLVARYAQERLHAEEDAAERDVVRRRYQDHLLDRCENALNLHSNFPVPWRLSRTPSVDPVWTPLVDPDRAQQWITDHVDVFAVVIADALAHDLDERATILTERAFRVMFATGSVSGLDTVMSEVARRAEARGDDHAAMVLIRMLGVGFGRAMRLDEAERTFDRVVELAARLTPRFALEAQMTTGNLALVWAFRGETRRAIAALDDLLDSSPPEQLDVTWIVLSLVEMHLQTGDIAAAERALQRFGTLPDRAQNWRSGFYENPVNVDIAKGAWSDARHRLDVIGDTLDTGIDAGRRVGVLTLHARVDAAEGRVVQAEATIDEAVAFARQVGCRSREMAAVTVRAEILTLTGRPEHAIAALTPEVTRSRELGLRYVECQTLSVLARAMTAAGRGAEARDASQRAAMIAAECGYDLLAREIAGDMPDPVSRAFLFW